MAEYWEKEVKEESKGKRQLIKNVLEKADNVQLLAVREYLQRHRSLYGYDSIQWIIDKALKVFDEKKYDDPHISYLVEEGELTEIIIHPEKARQIRLKAKEDSYVIK